MSPTREELAGRLRLLRTSKKWSQAKLAEAAGTGQTQVQKLESGERELTIDWMRRLGEPMGFSLLDFLGATGLPKVPVVGYVGAGAEILPIDDFAKGHGLDEVSCPSGMNPARTVAAIVRGDSMLPAIPDGWRVFYSRDPEQDVAGVVGKLCIVKLVEGPTMLKNVRRGPSRGRFNLQSSNAPTIEDAALEWASPVRAMLPPDS